MKVLTAIMLAEIGWLFFAASGPVWAFLLGFVGFVLTPALAFAHYERSTTVKEVSRG